jgi:hypothetical protein
MADFDHQDDRFFIINGIDNSVDALPHAVLVLTGQLLTSRWMGIPCQHFNALKDAADILIGMLRRSFATDFLKTSL